MVTTTSAETVLLPSAAGAPPLTSRPSATPDQRQI